MAGKRKRRGSKGKMAAALVSKAADLCVSKAADLCVENLLSTVLEGIGSAKDMDSHLESLQNTRNTIEALFLDADKVESLSHAQRSFLERLRCVVDKVDDLLDAKAARAKRQRLMGGRSKVIEQVQLFFSASISIFWDVLEIRAIRNELDSIARDHAQFGNTLSMLSVTMSQKSLAPSLEIGSLVIKEEVIGRDQDRDNIMRMVFDSTSNGVQEPFEVISIVGIGGIGKSTLAQYVYNDERVRIRFDVCLWVWATQDFEFREMLEKILESLTGERPDRYEMDLLQSRVQKQISGKKYFLVLDNLWDNQSLHSNWRKLRQVLMFGAPGSRILITTRIESVARKLGTKGDVYMLEDLTYEDSWLLFQQVAFREGQEPGVEAIGKEIATMCRNVPLVIRIIGGILVDKYTVKEWRDFRDDKFASLSLYGGSILQTLKLSYDRLEPYLKLCFLFCSLFPEGYGLEEHKLIRELIALGYVQKEYKNQSLMDAGKACVLSLLKRGLFSGRWSDGTLRMHDLIHDLAVSIAGLKFKMVRSKSDEIDERVRHVSFIKAGICWDSLSKVTHLQSLIIEKNNVTNPQLTKLLRFSPHLRVLRLASVGMKEVPTSTGKLIHLRHLDLSGNDFCELPESVKQLVHLQSLDLSHCRSLKQLPREIGELSNLFSLDLTRCGSLETLPGEMSKLVQLRQLRLLFCGSLKQMPIGLGNLTNLQSLDWFVAKQSSPSDVGGGLSELGTLNNLEGELSIIVHGRHCESSAANLQMKEKLAALRLHFIPSLDESHEEVLEGLQPHADLTELRIRGYQGKALPKWMMKNQLHCSLPNLVKIEVGPAKYCTHLCYFGRLPHLKFLSLRHLDSVEYIEEDEDAAPGNGEGISAVGPLFPSLRELSLGYIPKLKGWRRMSKDCRTTLPFPRLNALRLNGMGSEVVLDLLQGLLSLQTLTISGCEGLKEIPEWIDNLTALKYLSIGYCPKLMPLPKQIGNLPNLTEINIVECPGAFAEWWEDPTIPDSPLKHVAAEMRWHWIWSSSRDRFNGHKYSMKQLRCIDKCIII